MTTEESRIRDLIFWMLHRGDRHLWTKRHEMPEIYRVHAVHVASVRNGPFVLRRSAKWLQVAEFTQGAKCPDCPKWRIARLENVNQIDLVHDKFKKAWGAKTKAIVKEFNQSVADQPYLPLYRKHLIDDQGRVAGVVHLSQCPECLAILWAPVTTKQTDRPALRLVTQKRPKRSKPAPLLKVSAK